MAVKIDSYLPDNIQDRQDAVWYYGYGQVAKVSYGNYSVVVRCDGETKVAVPRDDGSVEYVRYADEWEALGVTTDKEMLDFTNSWLDKGIDIWVHNSWFDIYAVVDGTETDLDDVYLDAVCHEVGEAFKQAEAILEEVAYAGGWRNYLMNNEKESV